MTVSKIAAVPFLLVALVLGSSVPVVHADDITTLNGKTYANVRDVTAKRQGLFFVTGSGDSIKGVTVPFDNLPDDVKEKYHCDPFALGLAYAREGHVVNLNKNLAFSLDHLDAAEKKAQAQHKMLGFIMEWDSMLVPTTPFDQDSASALAHFYDVFNDGLVLVFVRHESELGQVPAAVSQGFGGPEEGGFAPNMAVVTADCSTFVCEIPYGDKVFAEREKIFRDKIKVIKEFAKATAGEK